MKNVKEFAKLHQITEHTLRAWIDRYELPVVRIGRRIYINEDDYAEWIESKKTTKTNELVLFMRNTNSQIAKKIKKVF